MRNSIDAQEEQVLRNAAQALAVGGCVVYPTETFYALGAKVGSLAALSRINAIKGRPQSKPLPVIIGHMDQLACVVPPEIADWQGYATARRLMECFWPGPLSLILPARPGLAPQLRDGQGRVCVRFSPHPQAQRLCLLSGSPLAATSANVSGGPAVRALVDLHPVVRQGVDALVEGAPQPAGGMPSTLVLPHPDGCLEILRQGAVPLAALEAAGFQVRQSEGAQPSPGAGV